MRKAIFAVLAVLMIIALFGGCQLAVEGEESQGEDMLCGIFITLDHLDMDMSEESIELPQNWNGDPNNIVFPETRIYAKRHELENGFVEYTFDNIEGNSFYMVKVYGLEEYETYNKTEIGSQIANGSTHVNVSIGDTSDNRSLTGTIYFDVNYPCTIYTNPVYQTPEGEVYMIQGSCTSYGKLQFEGSSGSIKLSDTKTKTVDGEETSQTVEVELNIEGVNTNKQVVLKQMDSDDQTIAEEVIVKDIIPETIDVLPDTQYMIMEEHCIDFEGKTVIKRTLLDMEEETVYVRFTGNNGIVETFPVSLKES